MKLKISTMLLAFILLALSSACSAPPWTGIAVTSEVIEVSPNELFDYLTDPKNISEIHPEQKGSKCEGEGVERVCTWKTELFGEEYDGTTTFMEFVPGQKTVVAIVANKGDIAFIETALYQPHPRGTKLVLVSQVSSFKLPSVLAKLPHDSVQAQVEKTSREGLRKIKEVAEKKHK